MDSEKPKTNGGDPAVILTKPELDPINTAIPTSASPVQSSTPGPDGIVDLFDEIIPHPDEVPHRNLILCFDGTGDQFDVDNSNIVRFFSMLKRDDVSQQMVYYQAGIGTYTIPELVKPWMSTLQKTIDMMVGKHLDAHIMGGYEFLMQNYKTGDKIFIFGFSRGAYTARALAGMIHKIGLLPPCNHQQVPFAYKMYTRDNKEGWDQSNSFKKTFSIDVDIEFVGVWDTVSSVGIIPHRLPFTASNNHIHYFRHAISLDERRARFKVNLWNRPTEEDHNKGVKKGSMPRHKTPPKTPSNSNGNKSAHSTLKQLERQYSDSNKPTDFEEVWFAGCHCDVGGGNVRDETRHCLARIPLRWMVRQCFILRTGILFHKNGFKAIGMDPDNLYPHVLPRPPAMPYTPDCLAHKYDRPINFAKNYKNTVIDNEPFISEEHEDLLDALTPIYDELRLAKWWWILEVLPYKHRYQKDNQWTFVEGINFGNPRIIPSQQLIGVKVHRTVQTRMQAPSALFTDQNRKYKKYMPAAKMDIEPNWIA